MKINLPATKEQLKQLKALAKKFKLERYQVVWKLVAEAFKKLT